MIPSLYCCPANGRIENLCEKLKTNSTLRSLTVKSRLTNEVLFELHFFVCACLNAFIDRSWYCFDLNSITPLLPEFRTVCTDAAIQSLTGNSRARRFTYVIVPVHHISTCVCSYSCCVFAVTDEAKAHERGESELAKVHF